MSSLRFFIHHQIHCSCPWHVSKRIKRNVWHKDGRNTPFHPLYLMICNESSSTTLNYWWVQMIKFWGGDNKVVWRIDFIESQMHSLTEGSSQVHICKRVMDTSAVKDADKSREKNKSHAQLFRNNSPTPKSLRCRKNDPNPHVPKIGV